MDYKPENNLSDRYLIEKVLNGNTAAFSTIIKNTERLVAQIVFKMIPNIEDRKDIAQDIYLKTFHKLGSFKFQSKLSTWIGQIAYNTCLSYLEKKKLVFLKYNFDNESQDEALEFISSKINMENETEKQLFRKELSEILTIEIEKLQPIYQVLINLYHNEELSYTEISQITQLPEGTVKNYLFRARKKLKENLFLTHKKEEL
ncbi:RNA polymerase sigma factor, sigma-70 family [Aequorivita sublithincola DSM 14238]|uniref:RNA polymerase sigma factor, sigma-70 family n=1 Tax=Aequorivita sublithincola (strain DSM 14238 / LMG 21431 / ACAM 643 / 9-3) TaxID=746697 RepID=I3Z028_AEQSU|nr:sigma-70 family RNA polymerase sigma factor [Aequorivita sublithincola]AFL82596.1 RNA polymerase sigma factor, sigma-70 family [Aequorivita sublithincola DSM 14238]